MTCLQPPKGSQHRFGTYNIYERNWERDRKKLVKESFILMWYTGSLLGYHDRLFSLMLDLFFQRSGARSAWSNFRPCRKMEEQVHTLLKTTIMLEDLMPCDTVMHNLSFSRVVLLDSLHCTVIHEYGHGNSNFASTFCSNMCYKTFSKCSLVHHRSNVVSLCYMIICEIW